VSVLGELPPEVLDLCLVVYLNMDFSNLAILDAERQRLDGVEALAVSRGDIAYLCFGGRALASKRDEGRFESVGVFERSTNLLDHGRTSNSPALYRAMPDCVGRRQARHAIEISLGAR